MSKNPEINVSTMPETRKLPLRSKWEVSFSGGTAYYPLRVTSDSHEIVAFHSFDANREIKANAIVALHNALLEAEPDVIQIHSAINTLPEGPWAFRPKKLLYPAVVIAGDRLTSVVSFDNLGNDEDIAQYLVELHASASRLLAVRNLPQQLTLAAAMVQSALPEGWSESEPGGLATNVDPIYGGIVDCTIQNGEWFVVPHLEGLPVLEGFKTRALAFDALKNAIEHCLKS